MIGAVGIAGRHPSARHSSPREPLPPVRNTYTATDTFVSCEECGSFGGYYRGNGLGVANQHARRTGHTTHCEVTMAVTYNRKST
jgi:hypothetical protein